MSQNDSPKDHDVLARILEKSTADPERIRRVMQDYDAYIERFNNLRDSRAWRKFTELDEDMGRGSGYWSSIYAKNEALHFHRLLIGLDFLGTDLKTFAASVSWTPPLNPPTSGYLFGFRDRTVKEAVPDGLESLLEWGQNVALSRQPRHSPWMRKGQFGSRILI